MRVEPWAEKKLRYISLWRTTSGVLAGLARSTTAAVATVRNAPPVPLTLSWQPLLAQVPVPPEGSASCAMSTGLTHFWK